jgi:methylthioribose-1-phosphate isomerase
MSTVQSNLQSGFATLRLHNGCLELIDQRRLPATIDYVTCRSSAETATAIRDLVVRGAPAIGCAAAFGVALEALRLQHEDPDNFHTGLRVAFEQLAASRPTAVNLAWSLQRMKALLDAHPGGSPQILAARLLAEANTITAEDVQLNQRMGEHGASLLPDGSRVLTHCNAGALATAGHGTALGVIRSAIAAGKRIAVYADETRPFLQGARLTAWELQQDGIPVTLIADSAAGYLMSRGRIDAVIVGADRVAANGDVANKIGTYAVAVIAARQRIPFYVSCPLSTVDMATASGDNIPIESRDSSEVAGYGDMRWAPEGIAIENPVFDVTPAELVTALITEKGVLHAPDAAGLRRLMQQQ